RPAKGAISMTDSTSTPSDEATQNAALQKAVIVGEQTLAAARPAKGAISMTDSTSTPSDEATQNAALQKAVIVG
ncbi:hypothetical protein CTI14_70780, partial [Methylobacterium radiotolerans]